MRCPKAFRGKLREMGLDPDRRTPSGIKAAVIREQGSNSEREMAYAMYLAGSDVKDVHMTDLIEGREDLSRRQLHSRGGRFLQFRTFQVRQRVGPVRSKTTRKHVKRWKISLRVRIRFPSAYATVASCS